MNHYFMKETVEEEALNKLQQFDKKKYQNAVVSDKPDIKNRELSVGVEVVIAEFDEIILNTKIIGKSLIEYFKMTNCPSIKISQLNFPVNLPEDDEIIEDFMLHNPVYSDNKGLPVFIKEISQLCKLSNSTIIYFPDKAILRTLNSEGIIQFPPATAQWVGQLPIEMMKQLKEKEQKIDGYEKFDEMNLYIKCFSGSIEEIKEFEELVKKYQSTFDCIYITDYWSEESVYEIVV